MVPDETPQGNPPYAIAMVVCDFIWRDPGTGKFTILGTFSSIAAAAFPCVHPVMAVFVALTDGRGKTPIKLRLIDVDEENDPLFEGDMDVEWTDPRMIAEIAFVVQGAAFPAPGEYRFQLFAGSESLMERRILILEITTQG
jgi:ribonuclease PH